MSLANTHAKGNYILGVRHSMIGSNVVNAMGEELGKIEDIVVDSRNSSVAYAILSFDSLFGIGGKHFAIPWEALSFDARKHEAVLNIQKEHLKNAPGFDRDSWPDMGDMSWQHEIENHYGSPGAPRHMKHL